MTSSPPFDSDEKSFLDQNNETNDEWVWSTQYRKKWEEVDDGHQTFYERWRKSSDSPKFPDKFPHELSLWEAGEKPLPFQENRTPGGKIIVTSSYNNMLHRLLRLRIKDMGRRVGAVITGQPGIGKTTFLKFMLAFLISARQVVILCNSKKIYLFYRGQVYSRPTSGSFYDLPKRGTSYFPIWTLIDVDYGDGGPPLDSDQNVWPIQASSPNRIRWKSWRKQNRAALLGMPLWSMDELMKGLYIMPEYESFRSALGRALNKSALPTNDTVIDAALKVFQAEKEKEKEREREREEVAAAEEEDQGQDRMDVDDSTRANEADQPRAPVDNAIDILVRDTTEKVGFAPDDVYNGIFEPIATMTVHDAAVRVLTYSKLTDIVEMFSKDQHFDGQSHRVVAVHPRKVEDSLDSWKVRFKSPRIEKEVLERMRLEEVKHLRKTYQLLRNIPAGSVLAGLIFEVIAHRMLCDAWQGPTQQPIRMLSNEGNPPVFSTDPLPTPDTLPSPPSPLCVGQRTATEVDFPTRLVSNVTLDGDKYYTLATTNDPLFDSFTIDHDPHQRTVVISIFQITISPMHGGSAQGYARICKIMASVRNLLKKNHLDATVEVAYFLVCPNDGLRHEWKMPIDWDKNTKNNNHQGAAFCLRLPVWKDGAPPPPDIDNL